MSKYIFVTFPRSGHHLIIDILRAVAIAHNIEFTYCEYYTCCQQVPCIHKNTIMKNHDFDLTLPQDLPNYTYIVMYRKNAIQQLEAFYRFHLQKPEDYDLKDCVAFIKENTPYYNEFIKKWVYNDIQNFVLISYEDVLIDCKNIIIKLFTLFYPHVTLDSQILHDIILRYDVKKKNTIANKTMYYIINNL